MFSGFRMERMSDGSAREQTPVSLIPEGMYRACALCLEPRACAAATTGGGAAAGFKVKSIMTRTDSISRQVDLILQESIRRRIDRFSFV